jgi:hypothetical protein
MKGSHSLMIPEAAFGATFAMMLPPSQLNLEERGLINFCVYIRIEYKDVDYPSVTHHTTACRVAAPAIETLVDCKNDYANAD